MSNKIAVLIDAKLHNELVLRTRKSDDVSHYIEHAVESFLSNNRDNDDLWSEEYHREREENESDDYTSTYGDPNKGYLWTILLLPNATKLKMTYKERSFFAEVRHGKIMDGEKSCSPSEWASKVANNTSRNAWRDIYIQMPGSTEWKLAEVLRQAERDKVS